MGSLKFKYIFENTGFQIRKEKNMQNYAQIDDIDHYSFIIHIYNFSYYVIIESFNI